MGFKVAIKDTDLGWKRILASVKAMRDGDSYVKIGVVEPKERELTFKQALNKLWKLSKKRGKKTRKRKKTTSDRPSNAQIAAWMEFGVPEKGIPERSFLRSTFDANREVYIARLRELVGAIYDGKMTVDKALNIIGLMASTDIKKRVTSGEEIPPPNSPKYKAWKERQRAAGNKLGARTLVLTGQMVRAVTWRVVLSSKGLFHEDGSRNVDKGKDG